VQYSRIRYAITLAASFGTIVAVTSLARQANAQVVELVYGTQLDPNDKTDPRVAAQEKTIQAFEAEYPNIKIKYLADSSLAIFLRALKSKSTTPDVVKFHGFGAPEFAATGSLQPIDDLVKRDNISETDWLVPLSQNNIVGKLYGLPIDYRIPLFLYRKGAFEAAGVQPPRTWEEVCDVSKKLTKPNQIGFALGLGSSGGLGGAQPFTELFFSSMVTEGTKQYFDDEGKKFLASKEQFIKVAETVRDLYKKCGIPMTALQFGFTELHDGLRGGNIASTNFGLYRFGAISRGGAGDDLAWAPPPSFGPNGTQTMYGFQLGMNVRSAQKEAAWTFIKFMGSPKAQAIGAEGGEVVARSSAYSMSPYFSTPAGQRQKAWAELVSQRGFLPHYPLSGVLFNQVVGEAFQRMVLKDGTPEEAYNEVVSRYTKGITP
jgi:multiple sugar transport system substrate-binding protein